MSSEVVLSCTSSKGIKLQLKNQMWKITQIGIRAVDCSNYSGVLINTDVLNEGDSVTRDDKVDIYISKASAWQEEIRALREIALKNGLDEGIKWGKPCYTFQGNNIAIIQPFKQQCGFMFFKGALLTDPNELLEAPGPNSQAAKRMMFDSVAEVKKMKSKLSAFIKEAIHLEQSGTSVPVKKTAEPIPEELETQFRKVKGLKVAFGKLTPGRQRAYILHFAAAKQSRTRTSRIEKYVPKILEGKGMHD